MSIVTKARERAAYSCQAGGERAGLRRCVPGGQRPRTGPGASPAMRHARSVMAWVANHWVALSRRAPAVCRLAAFWGSGVFLLAAPVFAQSNPCSAHKNEVVINSKSYTINSSLTGTALAPGKMLSDAFIQATTVNDVFGCTSAVITKSIATPTAPAIPGLVGESANYPVYPTGLPGIGFGFGIGHEGGTVYAPFAQPETIVTPKSTTGLSTGYAMQIYFFVTGALENGTHVMPKKKVGELRLVTSTDPQLATLVPIYLDTSTFIVNTKSCKLEIPVQSVKLPDVSAAGFKGVQSLSVASGSFTINLSGCASGIPISATMTDASNPGNRSNILGLTGDSTATGVGLQLYKNGESTALAYGPDSAAVNNPGRWSIRKNTETGSSFSIPFVVRYVQTGSQVTPGKVRAVSTITLSYQ